MNPIRIFRHDSWVGAGHFIRTLERNKFSYELVAIDQGEPVVTDINNVSGLAFLGGTMSVNDTHPWISEELNLICRAAEKNLPIIGHCFGAQLISKALGGNISTMPKKEIGWHAIEFLDNEICKQWFSRLPKTLDVLLWHEDAMTIPSGATPLYTTVHNPNQAFTIGNIIATIPHLEVTANMLNDWLQVYGYDLVPLSDSVQSEAEISRDLVQRISSMHQLADVIYDQWLSMLDADQNIL